MVFYAPVMTIPLKSRRPVHEWWKKLGSTQWKHQKFSKQTDKLWFWMSSIYQAWTEKKLRLLSKIHYKFNKFMICHMWVLLASFAYYRVINILYKIYILNGNDMKSLMILIQPENISIHVNDSDTLKTLSVVFLITIDKTKEISGPNGL